MDVMKDITEDEVKISDLGQTCQYGWYCGKLNEVYKYHIIAYSKFYIKYLARSEFVAGFRSLKTGVC